MKTKNYLGTGNVLFLAFIIILVVQLIAFAVDRTVMVDTNSVISYPTNFVSANFSSYYTGSVTSLNPVASTTNVLTYANGLLQSVTNL